MRKTNNRLDQMNIPTTKADKAQTEELAKRHSNAAKPRARIEAHIIRLTLRALAAAGYTVAVQAEDEGETDVTGCEMKLLTAIFDLDAAVLRVSGEGKKSSFVALVMGNDGHDVISDYGVSLESVLAPVHAEAERIADGGAI